MAKDRQEKVCTVSVRYSTERQAEHARSVQPRPELRSVALLYGVIYVVSGLWPIFHLRSFEAISGSKTDKWLVRTVGLLIAVLGIVALRARAANRLTPELRILGAGSAASLAAIDFIYSLNGTIRKVYLLDGFLQSGLALLWLRAGGDGSPRGTDEQN